MVGTCRFSIASDGSSNTFQVTKKITFQDSVQCIQKCDKIFTSIFSALKEGLCNAIFHIPSGKNI